MVLNASHVFLCFFSLPAQSLDIWVVDANCHRGNLFERCELDKRNGSRFYSIWETESSRPCVVPPCDIQRTALWKNLSHVEMRLERVKNCKPTAIDTRHSFTGITIKWWMRAQGFVLKVNKTLIWFEVNMKSKFTLCYFFFLKRIAGHIVCYGSLVHVILKRKNLVF